MKFIQIKPTILDIEKELIKVIQRASKGEGGWGESTYIISYEGKPYYITINAKGKKMMPTLANNCEYRLDVN